MEQQMALELAQRAMFTAIQLAAPIMGTALVVGITVNIFQTITSIKDMSLTFVPKVLVAAVVVGMSMPWAIQMMNSFFYEMYMMLGQMRS